MRTKQKKERNDALVFHVVRTLSCFTEHVMKSTSNFIRIYHYQLLKLKNKELSHLFFILLCAFIMRTQYRTAASRKRKLNIHSNVNEYIFLPDFRKKDGSADFNNNKLERYSLPAALQNDTTMLLKSRRVWLSSMDWKNTDHFAQQTWTLASSPAIGFISKCRTKF